jgi:hypothetical protein
VRHHLARQWHAVRWGQVAVACAFGSLVLRLFVAVRLGSASDSGDVWRFWLLGNSEGRPYIDYSVEYPYLTLLCFKALAAVAPGREAFGASIVWINVATDLAIAWVLWRGWGRDAGYFYLLASLPMVAIIDTRFDAVSTLLATIGVFLCRRRPAAGGLALGLGTGVKLWPGTLAAALLLTARTRWRPFLAGFVACAALAAALWIAAGGVDAVPQVLTYRGAPGWELNTLPGVARLAVAPDEVFQASGATRIGHVPVVVRVAMPLCSLAIVVLLALRRSAAHRLGVSWIGTVGPLLVFSALLSPQFVLWLLPAAAIAWVEGDRAVALLVAAASLLSGIEMARWEWLLDGRPTWLALVAMRDVCIVAAVALGVWRAVRSVDDIGAVHPRA